MAAAASANPQFLGGVGHGVGIGHGAGISHGVGIGHSVGIGHGVGIEHGVVGHAVAEVYPDEVSPFTYQYAVADDYSGARFDASETDDGTAARQGSYSVNLPDGRIQHVNYHANDIDGYVAEVTYEGTAVYPEAVAVGHAVGHGVVGGVGLVGGVGHGLVGGIGHGIVSGVGRRVIG